MKQVRELRPDNKQGSSDGSHEQNDQPKLLRLPATKFIMEKRARFYIIRQCIYKLLCFRDQNEE